MHTLWTRPILLLALSLPAWVMAQGAIYRQVDAAGRVVFSDIPLPHAKQQATVETPVVPAATNPALPYGLREVVSQYPVTLYTAKDCEPCQLGRQLLQKRGLPFSEKTITSQDDAQALQALSGAASVPLLTIGQQQLKGFSESQWQQYLSAAGYPLTATLPAGYQNPPATALVPQREATETAQPAPTAPVIPPTPVVVPAATPQNPAGIIF